MWISFAVNRVIGNCFSFCGKCFNVVRVYYICAKHEYGGSDFVDRFVLFHIHIIKKIVELI